MRGFCFSEQDQQLTLLKPEVWTDYFLLLSDYAVANKANAIALAYDDLEYCRSGVLELLKHGSKNGFNVIIVDPNYSPLDEEEIIPLWVHRSISTLPKYFPDCIVTGTLIPYFHRLRQLEEIKSYFQHGVPAVNMEVLTSGWVVKRTTGSADRISSRVYQYLKSRDYELESSNEKRRK